MKFMISLLLDEVDYELHLVYSLYILSTLVDRASLQVPIY